MKERIALWGPLGIVKRSLELGCTNVVTSSTSTGASHSTMNSSNTAARVDTSMNKDKMADCTTPAATNLSASVMSGLRERKIIPPTAEEIQRVIAASGR